MVQEEKTVKGISYLELWQPFCSVECNNLCNFGNGFNEEQFLEIILNFGSVVHEEIPFKRFLIWSSGGSHVRWSGTIYAILKEGIVGNIHVKLYEIWTSGSGGDVV